MRVSKAYGEHFQALKNWPWPKHCLDVPEGANVHPHYEEWAEDPVDREAGLVEVARRNRESLKTKQGLGGEPWFVLVEVEDAEFECECTHVDLGPDGVGTERWSSACRFYLVHPTADELAKLA